MRIIVKSIAVVWLSLLLVKVTSSEIIECHIPTYFTTRDNYAQFFIRNASMNVSIDVNEINISIYNDSRIVKAFAKNVEIHYLGDGPSVTDDSSGILIQDMRAYAEHELRDSGVYIPKRWRILLLPIDNHPYSLTTHKNVIRRLAEECLEEALPEKVSIKEEDFQDSPSINNVCLLPISSKYSITDNSLQAVQPLFNKFIDLMLEEGKRRFLDDINGTIPLHCADLTDIVNEHIFIRLSQFIIHSGKIWDLRNIYRTGNANIIKTGDKYTFIGDFNLGQPHLTLQHDTGIGSLRFPGDLNITVQKVDFRLTASFDESVTPCLLTVDNINITYIGKIDFSMNGFRPLNGIAESTASAALEAVKASVGEVVAFEIKDMGQRLLDTIDCEKLGIAHLRNATFL